MPTCFPSTKCYFLIFAALLLCACEQGLKPSQSIEVASVGAQGAAISDDGMYAIVGSVYQGGSLWRLADGERLYNWNHKEGEFTTIIAADFSPDGKWAMTADSHTMVLWSVSDGSAQRYWTAPGEILSLALSADGNFALLGLSNESAVLFDVKRGGIRRTFHHQGRVRSVALSDDSRFAVTGSEDFSAVLWDLASGQALHQMQHNDDVQLVAISADGQKVFSAAKYDKAVIWDSNSGQELRQVPLEAEKAKRGVRFTSAKFSNDGKLLLTGLPDRLVQLWSTDDMREQARWMLPKRDAWKPTSAAVLAVGFAPQNLYYFAVASNGLVNRLDPQQ